MDGVFESKTHLLAILDNMPFIAWYKDAQGYFIAVNQPFADGCGKPKTEIIGKTDFDVWPFDLATLYTKDDAEVMRTRLQKTVEEPIEDQSGRIWFETFKTPVFDDGGNVIGTIGMSRDISNRIQFQQELEDQKLFIKSMIDAIPDLVFYKDLNSVYLGCNNAFANLFIGLDEKDIIGKTDADFFLDPERIKRFRNKDLEIFALGKTKIYDETIQLVDGRFIDVETSKTPFYNEKAEIAGLIGISRDITVRKNIERKLKDQSEYDEMLLRTVPSAVYTLDNKQCITSWNTMAEKITGYAAAEVLQKNINSFSFHPCQDDCLLFSSPTKTPLSNLTGIIRNKKGETRYVLKNVDVLTNDNGEIIGRIECFDDITENMLVQNQLKESEMRLQLATGSARIGLWDWNMHTRETHYNEQWANIIGYTLDELGPIKIDTWNNLTHPDDLRQAAECLNLHISGTTEYYETEIRLKHKNGHWIWVLDRGQVIEWDSDHKPLRMVGTHIDISERKHTEEELQKKERILTAVAASVRELLENRNYEEAIAHCFELIGNATQVDRVYLFVNTYDGRSNGFASQTIEWNSGVREPQLNNPILQGLPFETISSIIKPLRERKPFKNNVKKIKHEATRKLLESQNILSVIVLPIFVQDTFWGFIGFDECKYERIWTESEFSTLSAFANSIEKAVERNRVEKELEESRLSAERANMLKSQFVANISHEIRTPMHAILGYASMMREYATNEQSIIYLNAIQKAGDTLMYLINDILDLSKIEADQMELQTVPVDIRQLFTDIRDVFSLKLAEKRLDFQMAIDPKIPETLLMDEVRIRQILLNLIGNAVKFTERGRVEVTVNVINYNIHNNLLDLLFEVKDTGIGIPEDQQMAIFEPFKQTEGQNNKKYGGTGLGLSISKRLVAMMDGSMTLSSKVNEGTSFVVVIPDIPIGKSTRISNAPSIKNTGTVLRSKMPEIDLDHPNVGPDVATAPPEMVEKLDRLKQGLWIECISNNRVIDIRRFAKLILEIGKNYDADQIIGYAAALEIYANKYNLPGIKKLLEQFPTLVAKYEAAINKGGL